MNFGTEVHFVRTISSCSTVAEKQNSLALLGKCTTVVVRVKTLNPKSRGLRSSLPKEKSAGGTAEGRNASTTPHRFTLQTVELLQALMSSGDLGETLQPRAGHLCPHAVPGATLDALAG